MALEQSLTFTDDEKLRLEQELMQLKSLCDKESSSNATDILSEQLTKISELEREIRSKMEEVEMMRQVNENLKLEHAEAEQEWNSKMERLRKELEFNAENLLKQRDLHVMLQKEHEELRDHMNKVIENQVQEVVSTKQQEIETLKTSLADSHRQEELEKIELIKHKLDESLQILNIRENDIKQLTNRLSEKDLEYNESLSLKDSDIENLRIQLLDTERKMSELLGQKDKDIQNLKIQLEERALKITELKQLLAEESNQLIELRKIVEDYEAQMTRPRGESEVSNSQSLSSLSYQETTVSTSTTENRLTDETDEGSSSDSQKELDLALYMLHQRDVRCDELTLELMQVRNLLTQMF
ncbi:hypothetical protein C0J52_15670 [Blattella germanica]|nr:hypothetical protein C0J52_15670 [Blattella germanica]